MPIAFGLVIEIRLMQVKASRQAPAEIKAPQCKKLATVTDTSFGPS